MTWDVLLLSEDLWFIVWKKWITESIWMSFLWISAVALRKRRNRNLMVSLQLRQKESDVMFLRQTSFI